MALPIFNNPPAYMGFVGFVRFRPSHYTSANGYVIRAKSAEMNVKQDITKPDIIDSRFDRTVYQLGPKEIDGSIEFPAVYDAEHGANKNVVQVLFLHAIERQSNGSLWDFPIDVKYASSATLPNQSEFTYTGCIVNSWNFSVAKQDAVNIKIEIMGIARNPEVSLATPPSSSNENNTVNNARAVTWNDARVEIMGQYGWASSEKNITGEYIRSFDCTINNNANRFYTLNGQLSPQAVAPTKRDINGKIVLMGRHSALANQAWNNENRASEDTQIRFGYLPKSGAGVGHNTSVSGFACQLPNVVFQIEEMSLTNDLFETTVNWHSLPAACDLYDYLYDFNTGSNQIDPNGGFIW